MKSKATIGTLISATMREEDLIPAFCDELRRLDEDNDFSDLLDRAAEIMDKGAWRYGTVESLELLNEDLFSALNQFAPAFCYFGAHEGDGSDYGFWPCMDLINERLEEEKDEYQPDIIKVSDMSEVPKLYMGFIVLVNDHGNVTLLYPEEVKYKEEWSIV